MQVNSSEWWDSMVEGYESNQDYRNRPNEFDALARYITGGPVLEIGPAFGEFSRYLAPDLQYLGMEISPRLAEEARKRHPDKLFVCADIARIGVKHWAKAFQHTVACQVLEHFDRETFCTVMEKLCGMTRESIIFSVPKGMPSPSQRKGDGHLIGWEDELDLMKDFSAFGEVSLLCGMPENHLCGQVIMKGEDDA